ncbi:MAG TPA: C25 family peptidase propeptide domain-containing protein, partial [Candidatus Cloacimonadota bacterium]|nr:C25 family peptidase propeptide domain-containing protein [Candidatus Cloacimonadota bacterium]
MKYTVLMLLMLLPILLAAGAVELISQSQDELILQFTLPDYKLEDFTYQGETRQRIVCDDANSFGEEGFPGLKSFSEALGIPVDGEIMIELIGHKNTVLSGVDLAPAPTIVL